MLPPAPSMAMGFDAPGVAADLSDLSPSLSEWCRGKKAHPVVKKPPINKETQIVGCIVGTAAT